VDGRSTTAPLLALRVGEGVDERLLVFWELAPAQVCRLYCCIVLYARAHQLALAMPPLLQAHPLRLSCSASWLTTAPPLQPQVLWLQHLFLSCHSATCWAAKLLVVAALQQLHHCQHSAGNWCHSQRARLTTAHLQCNALLQGLNCCALVPFVVASCPRCGRY
jgi:hypothetical protein